MIFKTDLKQPMWRKSLRHLKSEIQPLRRMFFRFLTSEFHHMAFES